MGQPFENAFAGPFVPSGLLSARKIFGYKADMPRIPDLNAHGIAFLFRTVEEATERSQIGGTAFFVGRPIAERELGSGQYLYAPYLVSNAHVVFGGSACVASVNRRDGLGTDIFDIDQNEWIAHPTADLAAVSLFGFIDTLQHKISFVPEDLLITEEFAVQSDLGVGDEVFMIGRFVNHQGAIINHPAARFGSISMTPETIRISGVHHPQLAYAVEMRSRTGFSGSPVSIYRTAATVLVDVPKGTEKFWGLLGVNAGYILDEDGSNTWLNAVIPAWQIAELLAMPAFTQQREREMAQAKQSPGRAKGSVSAGSAISDDEPAGMTEAEIAARRDAGLAKALATPHTVHSKKRADEAK